MPCQPVRLPDGRQVLVNVVPGQTLTDEDIATLVEFYTWLEEQKKEDDE